MPIIDRIHMEALESRCLLSAGYLDPTFGDRGVMPLDTEGMVTRGDKSSMIPLPGGAYALWGWDRMARVDEEICLIRRYTASGDLDSSFGANGQVTLHRQISDSQLQKVAVTADGGFLIVMHNEIVRVTPKGIIDPTYADGLLGMWGFSNLINFGFLDAIALPNGDTIAMARGCSRDDRESGVLLYRFNADGSIDTDFGNGGIVEFSIAGIANPQSMYLAPDGDILVQYNPWDTQFYTALARFNSDGTPDLAWATHGVWRRPGSWTTWPQPDGQVFFCKEPDNNESPWVQLLRLSPDGLLDSDFAADAPITTNVASHFWCDLLTQPDGKFLLLTDTGSITRYLPNGTVDRAFGDGGAIQTRPRIKTGPLWFCRLSSLTDGGTLLLAQHRDDADDLGTDRVIAFRLTSDAETVPSDTAALLTYERPRWIRTPHGAPAIVSASGPDRFVPTIRSQSDGRIVVGWQMSDDLAPDRMLIVRYTPDGTPDTSFGRNGLAAIPAFRSDAQTSILILNDDSILVIGNTVLVHLAKDGRLLDQVPRGTCPGLGIVSAAHILPDGKFVLVGHTATPAHGKSDLWIGRCNPDLTWDEGFGDGGQTIIDLGTDYGGDQVQVLPNGELLVRVWNRDPDDHHAESPVYVRIRENGSLDPTFGAEGQFKLAARESLWISSDGSLIKAGSISSSASSTDRSAHGLFLQRITPDGRPDPAFNSGDPVILQQGRRDQWLTIEPLPDGRILGITRCGEIYRFNPDGTPDQSFGLHGTTRIKLAERHSVFTVRAATLLPTGNVAILVGIYSRDLQEHDQPETGVLILVDPAGQLVDGPHTGAAEVVLASTAASDDQWSQQLLEEPDASSADAEDDASQDDWLAPEPDQPTPTSADAPNVFDDDEEPLDWLENSSEVWNT